MSTPIPSWADENTCKELPVLRARGESQNLEFMAQFPEQLHDLAREIAAFATSNAGTILVGVDDRGELVGLPKIRTSADRDLLIRRVEGVCQNRVKPSITPGAHFAEEDGHTVLVLSVPKGSQPLYSSNQIPYVRHLTSSRPAEPHEVIDLVRRWLGPVVQARETVSEQPDKRVQFLADLMRVLVSVRIYGEEFAERQSNPWLELVRAQFGDVAAQLREKAAEQLAVEEHLEIPLLDAAEALKQVATMTLFLDMGGKLSAAVAKAMERCENVLQRIEPEVIAYVAKEQLRDQLTVMGRHLAQLAKESDEALSSGDIEPVQTHAAEIGQRILFTAQYGVNRLAGDLRSTLTRVGHRLHLMETQRVYLDGGASVARIVGEIREAIGQYENAMASMG